MRTHGTFLRRARRVTRAMTRRRLACEASRIARQPARSSKLLATQNGTRILGGHVGDDKALYHQCFAARDPVARAWSSAM